MSTHGIDIDTCGDQTGVSCCIGILSLLTQQSLGAQCLHMSVSYFLPTSSALHTYETFMKALFIFVWILWLRCPTYSNFSYPCVHTGMEDQVLDVIQMHEDSLILRQIGSFS